MPTEKPAPDDGASVPMTGAIVLAEAIANMVMPEANQYGYASPLEAATVIVAGLTEQGYTIVRADEVERLRLALHRARAAIQFPEVHFAHQELDAIDAALDGKELTDD